ncbi:MAG: hypothetical protein HY060_17010 [Proteobacteria bacterium]|nr:hypothetical protein [Pseudomonadota bacterium]
MTPSKTCRILAAATCLAAFSPPLYNGTAAAADPATSNKGGEVRGTARADERAGARGDQGRDRAEANKTKANKGKSTAAPAGNAPK